MGKISSAVTRLQSSREVVRQRKTEIESQLVSLTAQCLAARHLRAMTAIVDELRAEYRSLEQKERFNDAALEEGRQALDVITGKVSMQVCHTSRPDYLKLFAPKARAVARAAIEFFETEQRFVNELLRCEIRLDHLNRIMLPKFLSHESTEARLRELAELE